MRELPSGRYTSSSVRQSKGPRVSQAARVVLPCLVGAGTTIPLPRQANAAAWSRSPPAGVRDAIDDLIHEQPAAIASVWLERMRVPFLKTCRGRDLEDCTRKVAWDRRASREGIRPKRKSTISPARRPSHSR
jgi:hypothetical protein